MISDGAAAIVLTDEDTAQSHDKAIAFRAYAQANDFLPMSKRDVRLLKVRQAWQKVWRKPDLGGRYVIGRNPRLLHHCRAYSI